MPPRSLLLTLDAFNTIFHPRVPVPEQYASTAHAFGLPPSIITPESLQPAFKAAYKAHSKEYPNYGRELALRGQYGGPRQWWEEVIRGSFARVLQTTGGSSKSRNADLPDGLLQRLLDRFASQEGYNLYPDVGDFMARMRDVKTRLALQQEQTFGPFERVVVGVLSNSDDRIPAILKSLGLSVGDVRADQGVSSMRLPGFEERTTPSNEVAQAQIYDLDLVITSYDAGEEKPSRVIFDVAKRQALRMSGRTQDESNWVCVHVGDDYAKDYQAAIDAGWGSYYITREEAPKDQDVEVVHSLTDLFGILESYK